MGREWLSPQDLRRKEICLQARIIAVADAFDAMNSNRYEILRTKADDHHQKPL